MGALDELELTLRVATKLLDSAASSVRDLGLAPVRDHTRSIGEAIAKVFEIHEAIYRTRPDLRPAFLDSQSGDPDADRRLTHALGEAYRRCDAGDRTAAVELLQAFVSSETSEMHKGIAQHELDQLQRSDD